jgi:hypothetical protein
MDSGIGGSSRWGSNEALEGCREPVPVYATDLEVPKVDAKESELGVFLALREPAVDSDVTKYGLGITSS